MDIGRRKGDLKEKEIGKRKEGSEGGRKRKREGKEGRGFSIEEGKEEKIYKIAKDQVGKCNM